MGNLLIFALIGLLGGAAARMLYPGRQPMHILGTMLLGMLGALAGGMISWGIWPAVDDQFQTGNLCMSLVGAMLAIVFWTLVSYARSFAGARKTSA